MHLVRTLWCENLQNYHAIPHYGSSTAISVEVSTGETVRGSTARGRARRGTAVA